MRDEVSLVLPGLTVRVRSDVEGFAEEISTLFETSSDAGADVTYECRRENAVLVLRRDDRCLYTGGDRVEALVWLYADLFEQVVTRSPYFLLRAGAAALETSRRARDLARPGRRPLRVRAQTGRCCWGVSRQIAVHSKTRRVSSNAWLAGRRLLRRADGDPDVMKLLDTRLRGV